MPKCPNCGEEIDYLITVREEISEYIFHLDSDGYGEYEYSDSWEGDFSNYECPICKQVLFENEDDAKEFLKQTKRN